MTPGTERACAALLDALPEVVSDAVRREVRGSPAGVAGWGDPLIVLRCGVGLPPEYRPDAVLTSIDGVAWLEVDGDGGTFYATVDRDPLVEVAVPDAYVSLDVLGDLAVAVADHVPERPLR